MYTFDRASVRTRSVHDVELKQRSWLLPAHPAVPQVDLSREASNLRRFNHNFRKTRHVFFPVPLYPLVTPDVLVESFESGEHITAYIQSDNNPYNHRCAAAFVRDGSSFLLGNAGAVADARNRPMRWISAYVLWCGALHRHFHLQLGHTLPLRWWPRAGCRSWAAAPCCR